MTIPQESPPLKVSNPRQRRSGWRLRLTPGGVVFLLILNCVFVSLLAFILSQVIDVPWVQTWFIPSNTPTTTNTLTPLPDTPTPSPTITPSPIPFTQTLTPLPSPIRVNPLNQGLIVLSLREGGYSHLFVYQPFILPITRLMNGAWDDITPAISPDQTHLAFSSNRSGQWDLYLLDLNNGDIVRLTDTPEYDGAPSWSPDGFYLAFETYVENNLEIAIRSVSDDSSTILISNNPAADFSPTWSPLGRQIAFVSTRGSGGRNLLQSSESDIWLVDLDKAGDAHFVNVSRSPLSTESHPVWAPDGSALAWASIQNGWHSIFTWKSNGELHYAGDGDWPAWSPDGSILLTSLQAPNQTRLTAYDAFDSSLCLPPILLPGSLAGLVWQEAVLPSQLPAYLQQAANLTPTPVWLPEHATLIGIPGNRQHLVTLPGVQAPFPQLQERVNGSFQALQKRTAAQVGWDFLSSLENAFVPLTAPLAPSMINDWLLTGRAFAFTPLPISAGWLVVIPEEFGSEIYWHIYLRARFQDGSQGMPLYDWPWDFNARYSGDPLLYDQGGARAATIPNGYWVDFTELAATYGWERLSALPNWHSFYPAARFNEFVFNQGLDWRSAMLEIYPPEALLTPAVILSPTPTPTITSRWYKTPTPTATTTPRPTFTPITPTIPATETVRPINTPKEP